MKKITATAAALALSAAMLAGSAPKANATNINRTPGAFGRYVAGAAVERIFPSDRDQPARRPAHRRPALHPHHGQQRNAGRFRR